jgi:hypothetical protein
LPPAVRRAYGSISNGEFAFPGKTAMRIFASFETQSLDVLEEMMSGKLTRTGVLLAGVLCLGSCATPLSQGNPDYTRIVALVRDQIGKQEWLGNISVNARGSTATAYYVLQEPMAQQPSPMKTHLVKKDGEWVLISTESNKPWHWRFK